MAIMNKKGRIIKQVSNDYSIALEGEIVVCKARGKFRNMGLSPLVGDFVSIDYENRYILEIEKRKNELERPSIANVDQALIVTSVEIPSFSSNLLDKLLVILEYNRISPVLCFTKMDLVDENLRGEMKDIMNYYRRIGYPVYENSDPALKEIFKDKVTVFAGQSGAGKSTLLNRLDSHLNLETGEVSIALGRGRHTTRHVELLPVLGGLIADTPGFSSLDFKGMTNTDIRDQFIEFNQYREECKYQDCMHQKEDDCEVKRKVKEKEILASRYENYLKFIDRENFYPSMKDRN